MFASLVEWCKFPVLVHPFTGRSGTGDKTFGDPVEYLAYRVDDTKVITDKFGKEYVSTAHVYFKPDAKIAVEDMISFPDEPTKREIRKLGGYYDGNNGKRSIWVVYL